MKPSPLDQLDPALIPPEERIRYSAMTGQSLYYLGETNLQHKILAIAEEDGTLVVEMKEAQS